MVAEGNGVELWIYKNERKKVRQNWWHLQSTRLNDRNFVPVICWCNNYFGCRIGMAGVGGTLKGTVSPYHGNRRYLSQKRKYQDLKNKSGKGSPTSVLVSCAESPCWSGVAGLFLKKQTNNQYNNNTNCHMQVRPFS
jgi:hypothetical protein